MLRLLLVFTLTTSAFAAEIVRVGSGSYLAELPDGAKGPPAQIYKTADLRGPIPTNDWWSSLAWVPFSDVMYPHPLAIRATEHGLRIYFPGPDITANTAAIFASMQAGGDDFVLGHSTVEKFADARVAGWSDWFVTAQFGDAEHGLRVSFGHGSPFVFAQYSGGEPVITFAKPPELFAGGEKDAALGVRIGKRAYGLFAPSGSSWSGIGTTRLTAQTNGRSYFSIAVLPDDKLETLALFQKHAYAHVTDTRVTWSYDEKHATVRTEFQFMTKPQEGAEQGTLFALYPHQWRSSKTPLTGQSYPSVRGPMKLAQGSVFSTEMPLPPVLPGLPLTASTDVSKLRELLAADVREKPKLVGDTYWLGKQLGRMATLLPLADEAGDKIAAATCSEFLRGALENFFTASDTNGAPKKSSAGVFAYDKNWGTLIGYPASFGSDDQLNDHHFHYGYFIRAAAELARYDAKWASEAQWGGMIRLLVRDVASPDRADPMFPFLRCFDPYAGHSWASGHAKFADGNNNESSSEAVNAWYGVMMFGEAIGDRTLRDLGAWLFTTEIAAIEDYWFDVRGDLRPPTYPASVVTMVWGGKGANGTWFSGNPEAVHGINWLPITGGSLYLGRWPDYARRNYTALVGENLADDAKKAARNGRPVPTDGTRWDQWADIIWMYRALADPADARRQFEARATGFKPEAGNSLAMTYAWLTAFEALGEVDRSVSADAPFAAVFSKQGKRTRVASNLANAPRTVTFSDGMKLECPARASAVDR